MLSRRRNLILVVLAAALASAGLIFYAWRAAFKVAGEVPAPEGAYKSVAFGVFGRLDTRAGRIFDGTRLTQETNQPKGLLSPARTEEFLQKRLEVVSSPAPLVLSPDELRKKYFSLLYPEVYLSYLRDNQDWLVSEGVLKPEEKVEFKNEDEVFAFLKKLGAYVYSKKIIFTDPAAAFDSEIETLKKLHNGEAEALERGILRPVGPSGFIGKIKFLALKLLGIKTAYAAGECYRDAGPNPIVGANTPTICCDCGIQRIGKIVFPVPDAVGCKTFGGQCNVANFGCLNGAGWGGNAIWDPASKICGYDAGGGFSFLGIISKIFGVFGIISDLGDFLGGALGDVVEQTVSDLDEIAQAMPGVDPNLAAAIDDLASVEDIVTFDDYFAILDEHNISLDAPAFESVLDGIPTEDLGDAPLWGVVDPEKAGEILSERAAAGDALASQALEKTEALAAISNPAGTDIGELKNLDISSVLEDKNEVLLKTDASNLGEISDSSEEFTFHLEEQRSSLLASGVPAEKIDELASDAQKLGNTAENLKEFKENGFIFDENSDLDGPGIGADGEPAYYVMGEDISAVPPVSENEAAGRSLLEPSPPVQEPPPPPQSITDQEALRVGANPTEVAKSVRQHDVLNTADKIEGKYGTVIDREVAKYENVGLTKERVEATIINESSGRSAIDAQDGKSSGIMQIKPETARGLDREGVFQGLNDQQIKERLNADPELSIKLGVRNMGEALKHPQVGGDYDKMVAYYNGGPRALNESKTCGGSLWWSCTANSGYAVTRNKVAVENSIVRILNQRSR